MKQNSINKNHISKLQKNILRLFLLVFILGFHCYFAQNTETQHAAIYIGDGATIVSGDENFDSQITPKNAIVTHVRLKSESGEQTKIVVYTHKKTVGEERMQLATKKSAGKIMEAVKQKNKIAKAKTLDRPKENTTYILPLEKSDKNFMAGNQSYVCGVNTNPQKIFGLRALQLLNFKKPYAEAPAFAYAVSAIQFRILQRYTTRPPPFLHFS